MSGQLSPVSSMSGPTRPSAPMSPVNFDDYSSDWDFDFDRRTDESFHQRSVGHQGTRSAAGTFDTVSSTHQVGGSGGGGGGGGSSSGVRGNHLSSTPTATQTANRGGRGADDGGSAMADVGLFSFDEARRVLDELNERLRTYGGGSGVTNKATRAASAARDQQGTENHLRGRERSSADGGGRTSTTGTTRGGESATGSRASAWNGGTVDKRNGIDKHRSNYPE